MPNGSSPSACGSSRTRQNTTAAAARQNTAVHKNAWSTLLFSAILVNSGEKATVASPVPAAHTPMASPQCERNQRRIKIDAGTIEPKA